MPAPRPPARGRIAPKPRVQADLQAPLVLALDASSPVEALALVQGSLVLAEQAIRRPRRRGVGLAHSIEQLVGLAGRRLADLDGLALVTGPGAFTGLRVALATAQGLAKALGIPAWGFDSLVAWAAGQPSCDRPIGVVLDARRDEIYTALYAPSHAEGLPQPLRPLALESPTRWLDALDDLAPEGALLLGEGARLYRALLADRPHRLPLVTAAGPCLAALAAEVAGLLTAGISASPDPLQPLYMRDHDGAMNKRAKT